MFAPAAAHLAAGRPLEDMGPELKTDELMSLTLPEADILTSEIRAQVLDVDRFGNVRLNVRPPTCLPPGWRDRHSRSRRPTRPRAPRACRPTRTSEPGAYAIIEDAWGWIIVNRLEANAAAELGVRPGDAVWLMTADD